MDSKLMSVTEVAEYFGVPKRVLYNLRHRGDGPKAVRIGRELRFDPADILAWLQARKTAA